MADAPTHTARLDAVALRQVLLVQALEQADPPTPLWGEQDRTWAHEVARATAAAGAPDTPGSWLARRAAHALQRLAGRDAALARWASEPRPTGPWPWLAVGLAAAAGLVLPGLGSSQHLNLLAPPVWAVLAWNAAVLLALCWPRGMPAAGRPNGTRHPLALRLAQAWQRWEGRIAGASGAAGADAAAAASVATGAGSAAAGLATPDPARAAVLARARAAWHAHSVPWWQARAAAWVHAAAAALALGLIAGLYLRGLVWDYRVGWQSTFLQPATVHALLEWLMAPAVALTGIGIPDVAAVAALRVGPDEPARAPAAPWLHQYAALLLMVVVLPRGALALAAAWRARRWAQGLPLALDSPGLAAALRAWRSGPSQVGLWPHGAAPGPASLAALPHWVVAAWGDGSRLRVAGATAHGDEDQPPALPPGPPVTQALAWVELAATPQDDTHGRWLRALRRQPGPWLLLVDEAGSRARFAHLPQRLQERRQLWRDWGRRQGVPVWCDDFSQPAPRDAESRLQAALSSPRDGAGR